MENFEFLKIPMGTLYDGMYSTLVAIMIGAIAFVLACGAKDLFSDLASRWHDKLGDTGVDNIGQVAYVIVLLLFAPAIFERLGVASVTTPLVTALQQMFSFLPNIIGAALIMAIGVTVARIAKSIIAPMLERTGMNKLLYKAGIESDSKLSNTVAHLIYVVILIPVIIASLETLHLRSLTQPAVMLLNKCILIIPNIIVSILLISIGCLLAKVVSRLLQQLIETSGIDMNMTGLLGNKSFRLSNLISIIAHVVIILFFTVEALNTLQLTMLTEIGKSIIRYIPNILGAVFIFIIAMVASKIIKRMLNDAHMPQTGRYIHIAIFIIATVMAFSQLGLANHIIDTLFSLLVFGIAIAFGLSFGLGGREAANRILQKTLDDAENSEEEGADDIIITRDELQDEPNLFDEKENEK
jgi:hypothetical protein